MVMATSLMLYDALDFLEGASEAGFTVDGVDFTVEWVEEVDEAGTDAQGSELRRARSAVRRLSRHDGPEKNHPILLPPLRLRPMLMMVARCCCTCAV